MPKRLASFALVLSLLFPVCGQASNPVWVQDYVPHVQKVGEGDLNYAFWPIYRATLYAPHGRWSVDKPFALTLTYHRRISGKIIAETSIEEIRRLYGKDEFQLAAWYEQMLSIFPDVDKGVQLTGIHTADKGVVFFKGNHKIGEISDPAFSKAFFSIWLSPQTQAVALRDKLLGQHD